MTYRAALHEILGLRLSMAIWLVIWVAVVVGLVKVQTVPEQTVAATQSATQSQPKSSWIDFDPEPSAVIAEPRATQSIQENFELAATAEQRQPELKENHSEIVVAPFPISHPALGSDLVVVGGYLFPLSANDHISPASMIGGKAFYTSNGSWLLGAGAKLYLIRLTGAYGQAQLKYDLYGIGNVWKSGFICSGRSGRQSAIAGFFDTSERKPFPRSPLSMAHFRCELEGRLPPAQFAH